MSLSPTRGDASPRRTSDSPACTSDCPVCTSDSPSRTSDCHARTSDSPACTSDSPVRTGVRPVCTADWYGRTSHSYACTSHSPRRTSYPSQCTDPWYGGAGGSYEGTGGRYAERWDSYHGDERSHGSGVNYSHLNTYPNTHQDLVMAEQETPEIEPSSWRNERSLSQSRRFTAASASAAWRIAAEPRAALGGKDIR